MEPHHDILTADEARGELYDIMRRESPFVDKVHAALELGRRYLEVENGHLARVDPSIDYWETLVSTDGTDGPFPVAMTLDLGETYCRRTIEHDEPLALHDAPNQGWADDPAFQAHGLRTYHGVPITLNNDVYGSICFVSQQARSNPFTEGERMFTDLMAQMLNHELERAFHRRKIAERERLIGVLNRVIRHNLRNDLNVVRGGLETIEPHLPPPDPQIAEDSIKSIDELILLSHKAKRLHDILDQPEGKAMDVERLIEGAVSDVQRRYPSASIDVATTNAVPFSQQIQRALVELIENAAKHSGEEPHIDITVEETEAALRLVIADDGPGLPSQEQTVLTSGDETPLEHGSGLGLWLVHWVVSRHDGQIDATVDTHGTTISIEIPVAEPIVPTKRLVPLPSGISAIDD